MKFPSIQSLVKNALSTLLRFPLPIAASFIGTAVAIYLTRLGYEQKELTEQLGKIVMVCSLALPLLFSINVFAENNVELGQQKKIGLISIAIILLVLYYVSLSGKLEVTEFNRFFVLNIGLHLLVAYAAFIGKEQINAYWQFNKTLFLRFLTSVLYSGVLYLGLLLAMVAVDNLLGIKINEKWYLRLWIFMAGIFNTWFFLAGVPKDISSLEENNEYPKGLKIFTQFVLLPLVTLYLGILYAYSGKILVLWSLPKGWVSYLILGFSILGILSILLIYPIREKEENSWIKVFSRWFYRALFPLIILLGVAIGKRVMEYGITENRYFILILAMWLTSVAIYFLVSKNKNIKLIPITLSVLAFVSCFGPLSAFSVSLRSQVKQLENLLTDTRILVNGKIQKAKEKIDKEKSVQINSIVRYLDKSHGYNALQPWFDKSMEELFKPKEKDGYVNKPTVILSAMGVKEMYEWENEERNNFYASANYQRVVDISFYDYMVVYNGSYTDTVNNISGYKIGTDSITINYKQKNNWFTIQSNNKTLIDFSIQSFLTSVKNYADSINAPDYNAQLPIEKMSFVAQNDSVMVKVVFKNFSCDIDSTDAYIISYGDADLLYKKKR